MKKNYLNYILITAISIILILFLKMENAFLGSNIDWFNQHVLFADYFRELFFKTKNIFPDLALNLGSGINIYNLTYYGLFNPLIMLSYVFKQVPMIVYMQILNVFLYTLTNLLFYKFLLKNKIEKDISLITTLLFLTAGPLIYHFNKQIMFVNYLPFLLIVLIKLEDLMLNKKFILPVLSFCVIGLSSYFYLPISIITIFLFAYYLIKKNNLDMKKCMSTLLIFFLVSCMMLSFCILPTIYALLSSRTGSFSIATVITNFRINISLNSILYDTYGIGLVSISIVVLLMYLFVKNTKFKHEKTLSWIILILCLFPTLSLILNGGLYARSKILIPLIILIGYLIAHFIQNNKNILKTISKKNYLVIAILYLIVMLSYSLGSNFVIIILLDMILVLLTIFFMNNNKQKLYKLTLSLMFIVGVIVQSIFYYDEPKLYYEDYYNEEREFIKKEIKDESFYRVNNFYDVSQTMNEIYNINFYQTSNYGSLYNKYYYDFLINTMKISRSEDNDLMLTNAYNPILMSLLNVKYYYGYENILGYQKIDGVKDLNLYKNDNTFSLGYVTDKVYSKEEFDKLEYQDKMKVLSNYSVVDKKNNNTIEKVNVKEIEKVYNITLDEDYNYKYQLENFEKDDLIFISFDINRENGCLKKDRTITINGISNQITCDNWLYSTQSNNLNFVVSSAEELNINMTKGKYTIDNIKVFTIDYNELLEYSKSIDKIKIQKEDIKEDEINATVSTQKDGYFITSLPYDKGYKVYLNDKLIETEIVNTAFLGFKINKGEYNVKIIYEAPLAKEGKYFSLIGIVLLLGISYQNRKVIFAKSDNN